MSFPHGCIEHINHLTFEPAADVVIGIGVKHSVENGIDDIAQCASEYQGDANEQTPIGIVANAFDEVPKAEARDDESEKRKDEFAHFSAAEEFHAIGHAIVFDEVKFKPIAEDGFDFAEHKMPFDVGFDPLIDDQE